MHVKIQQLLFAAGLALGTARLGAQGTKADYERAWSLPQRTEDRVYRQRIRPKWLGETAFWYEVKTGPGAREHIFVDAETGVRKAALDHGRLLSGLTGAAGAEPRLSDLEVVELDPRPENAFVVVRSGDKHWRCDLRTYECRENALELASLPSRHDGDVPRASRRTGQETEIVFVNRTDLDLELYWLDAEGQRRSYGRLGRQGERRQHTFGGHVRTVVDREGTVLGVFEAKDEGSRAVVGRKDGPPPEERKKPAPRPEPGAAPDGRWIAFFKDHNVHLRSTANDDVVALSTSGTEADPFERQLLWSPDSRWLAVVQTQKVEERKVHFVESSPRDQTQPRLHAHGYAKPGDPLPVPRPRVFDVEGRRQVPINDELHANAWSVSEWHWTPDSKELRYLYNPRGHRALRLLGIEAASGAVRAIVDEQSRTFVDYAHKEFTHWLDSSGEVLWMSERDGWNHLYLLDTATTQVKNQVTQGAWVVRRVERVDEEKRQIWFFASGIRPQQDPYYLHFCRVGFDGTGLVILTEGDGTHAIDFSPDRRYFIDTYSRVDLPPVTELRRALDGRLICELERADASALVAAGWTVPQRFQAKGRDGTTDIFGIIIRPSNFDPSRRYPLLEEVYAGPHGAHVPREFGRLTRQHVLAELGFIVVQADGMGTSWRSKAFHDVAWKNLADAGFPDRIAWIKSAAQAHPEMDITRVGILGGSAGGQNALRALIDHGDFYRAAVADCGCHDNRMDKVWWNELWMSWPVGPEYEASSNVAHAHRLQGKLLLIVGEMDTNVDPASTMQVVNALVKADKDFELLVMPGTGHGAAETPYASRRRMDFFVRHLWDREPRAEP